MAAIDDEIIAPALWLVGELWERGEISVADEHLATEISIRVLALQREARRIASGLAATTASCSPRRPGELHVVALRMTADLLRDAGYDVVMLGADVPARRARRVGATATSRDVICLSSTMPGGGDQVLISIHEVQQTWPAAGFVVGGRGLTSRVRSRPGIEVCERVTDAVEAVDAMVKHAATNWQEGLVSPPCGRPGRPNGGMLRPPTRTRSDSRELGQPHQPADAAAHRRRRRRRPLRRRRADRERRPAVRERPLHASASPRASRPPTGSCCGRAWPPIRSTAAASARRPTASGSRSPGSELPAHRAPRPHASRARGGPYGPRRGHGPAGRSATTGTASSRSGRSARSGASGPRRRTARCPST